MGEAPCISLFLKSFSAALSFPQLQRCPTDEPFPQLAPCSGVRETNVHSRDVAMCFSPWNGRWNAVNITALFLAASNRWCFEARGMEGRSSCYKGALLGTKYFLCFPESREPCSGQWQTQKAWLSEKPSLRQRHGKPFWTQHHIHSFMHAFIHCIFI